MAKLKLRVQTDQLPFNNESSDIPLRDRKKARQRIEMLDIALRLFREKGFDNTRMEDIAILASVSTPTVYNYFQTKRDLLVELLKEDRENSKAVFEDIVARPPSEPEDAFAALIHANLASIRDSGDKMLWREILAAVARSHDKEQDSFEKNHGVFKRYIKKLLVHFVDKGKISKTLPVDMAVDIIFAINSHNLRNLASSEKATPEKIRDLARQQIKLLLNDWRSQGKAGPSKAKAQSLR